MEVEGQILKDLNFNKKHRFPDDEKKIIVEAVKSIDFKDFRDYKEHFDKKLAEKLKRYGYTDNVSECRVFKDIKSRIKDTEHFRHEVDLYHPKKRIAIEIEKTKTTTLLLDVMKFVMGYRRKKNGGKSKPIIEYGVIIIPDKYRNEKHPEGQGDRFLNRLKNELVFINSILWIKDILIVVYDTSIFFNKRAR